MPREKSSSRSPARKSAPRESAARRKNTAKTAGNPPVFVDPESRTALIARAAYFRAERRGFVPGHEVDDWLAAEAEVDARLLQETPMARDPVA